MFTGFGRTGVNPRHRLSHSCQPVRPALERLEDRCLPSGAYLQTNLVSDLPGVAKATDANLKNPWGIAASSSSPFWVADNATGVSTLYNGSGVAQSLVVTVPTPASGS